MATPTKRPRAAPRRAGPAANPVRGEHEVTLGGAIYRLRPSFTAMAEVEANLGRSIIDLARDANAMKLTYTDLGTILAPLIREGADKDDRMTQSVHPDRLSELVFEEGVSSVMARVLALLFDCISGGRTASGEAKAVT